jgi:epoxyqueuosine reductase
MPHTATDNPDQSEQNHAITLPEERLLELRQQLNEWARELGFQQVGVSGTDLEQHGQYLQAWLQQNYHGDMAYMADHGDMRWHPEKLQPGTVRIISLRMDYLAPEVDLLDTLRDPNAAYISRYALGRDYHKLIRKRLTLLGNRLREKVQEMGFRAFVDSAPILERAAASEAGLGWIGKNCMLINRSAGSWFFLGELLTDLPLPVDNQREDDHCGRCERCHQVCPTQAFVGDRILDARRCISYLTIELTGSIPVNLRKAMGNRIFGCDDCQLACPWNRFAKVSNENDFSPRHRLDKAGLLELFNWDEATFLNRTEGMPIRRTGYENWLRNIAVALGNAPYSKAIVAALQHKRPALTPLVQEHIDWALQQQMQQQEQQASRLSESDNSTTE